jgi:hypothetical protein
VRIVQLVLICKTGCDRQGCEHVLQEVSLPTAESKGTPWTDEELEFLLNTTDESLTEVARALGRTYYATSRARSLHKRGILRT